MLSNHKKLIYLGPKNTQGLIKKNLENFEIFFPNNEKELKNIIKSINVIFDASMKIEFNEEILINAINLELLITATTGFSHIDVDYLSRKNIPLKTLGDQKEFLNQITPAAELSWLLLMMCARKVLSAVNDVKIGNWDRTKHPGEMLNGKKLGIIGLGRLGKWMARYGNAFGMKCYGYDPYNDNQIKDLERKTLEEILKTCDFITLHVNYNPGDLKIITSNHFKLIKKGAIFINTSRGELVDENALIEALKDGTLKAVGIDVLSGEPDVKNNELFKLRNSNLNLVITPHIGGFCEEVLHKVLTFSSKRIIEYYKND